MEETAKTNYAVLGKEVRYPFFPELVRAIDFETFFIIKYRGAEFRYEGKLTEERARKETSKDNLEKKLKEHRTHKDL